MSQWNRLSSRTVRGMRVLQDRCPEHNALPIWYSLVEMTVSPMRAEVARYDCGCMVTVDADTMGAPTVREAIIPTDETVGE